MPPVLQLAAKRPADQLGRGCRLDGDRGVHAQRGDDQSDLMAVTRNAGATYFIPSENEWYKAAYYNPTERHVLDLPDAEQHRAEQHPIGDGNQQRQFLRLLDRQLQYRPDELPDAGGRVRRLARPLRHVRHGRRRFPVE